MIWWYLSQNILPKTIDYNGEVFKKRGRKIKLILSIFFSWGDLGILCANNLPQKIEKFKKNNFFQVEDLSFFYNYFFHNFVSYNFWYFIFNCFYVVTEIAALFGSFLATSMFLSPACIITIIYYYLSYDYYDKP